MHLHTGLAGLGQRKKLIDGWPGRTAEDLISLHYFEKA